MNLRPLVSNRDSSARAGEADEAVMDVEAAFPIGWQTAERVQHG
jgi:hypothetical protein